MNKIGNVSVLCGGRNNNKTLKQYLEIQKWAIENGFEKVEVEILPTDLLNEKQLKESNLIKYLSNITKLISSGEIPKDVYDKYLSSVPCGFMNEKELRKWFLEKSDK